jgi:4-hydroxy-3-polyprenylbenzoate decarboxylase
VTVFARPGGRQSLRPFLEELAARGELRRIAERVAPEFEISACLSELAAGPALLFDDVAGSNLRIVGNVLNTRERIAAGLGVAEGALADHLVAALAPQRRRQPRVVDAAPCHERELRDPDLAALPIPRFFEHEGGPYITAGAIVARDPASGRRNWSIARIRPLGGSRALVGIAPNHHLAILARGAAERGERLPIAVAVGLHPALLVAACLYLQLGDDELEVAGALLGEPVELARCRSVPLEVPAHAELVLEGLLDAADTVDEGRVSEFHGMYEAYGRAATATFTCLTRRDDAVLQVVEPGYHPEHVLLGAVAIAAGLEHALRELEPAVARVHVTDGGCGRTAVVIALGPHAPGAATAVIDGCLARVSLVKQVTVVDDDVDVTDAEAVAWAVATRLRPERDLELRPGQRADRAEPLEVDRTVTKVGLDATRHDGDRDWERAAPPADVVARMRALLGR